MCIRFFGFSISGFGFGIFIMHSFNCGCCIHRSFYLLYLQVLAALFLLGFLLFHQDYPFFDFDYIISQSVSLVRMY